MNPLYRNAILKASEVRKLLGTKLFQPINIFDACINLGISVRFVDINMEGLYVKDENSPMILISNQRPFSRRCFTCAHELGHHFFNHGFKLDILSDESEDLKYKDKDELLVDAFAGAMLMPIGGIQAEFAKRSLDIEHASPIDFYVICSIFGVGYQTLIYHCKVNGLISEIKATSLLKSSPAKIFKSHFGEDNDKSYFRIIDQYSDLSVVDLEVSDFLITTVNTTIEEGYLEKIRDTKLGSLYRAKNPGILTANTLSKNYFIRIQKENYIGFAEYRHLEN